jgi:hypothetical protein
MISPKAGIPQMKSGFSLLIILFAISIKDFSPRATNIKKIYASPSQSLFEKAVSSCRRFFPSLLLHDLV